MAWRRPSASQSSLYRCGYLLPMNRPEAPRAVALGLAKHTRDVCSPAAYGIAAAQAEAPRIGRVVLNASRVPSVRHFAAFQIWHELADTGREVLFECVSPRPDVRIAIVDFVAVSH